MSCVARSRGAVGYEGGEMASGGSGSRRSTKTVYHIRRVLKLSGSSRSSTPRGCLSGKHVPEAASGREELKEDRFCTLHIPTVGPCSDIFTRFPIRFRLASRRGICALVSPSFFNGSNGRLRGG
jgi:hypothetical protein